jgi:heme exporter protein A
MAAWPPIGESRLGVENTPQIKYSRRRALTTPAGDRPSAFAVLERPWDRRGGGTVLAAESVAVFRGERLVFQDLSLAVRPGGALVLQGPNGAGKSTLLRLLAGLVRPAAGRLVWDGQDALADPAQHGARVAYLGHLDAVKPGLTVTENLRFAAAVSGRPIEAALAGVGLQDLADLPARMLSAGQKRRLALSRLLLSQAVLWLLDEPTLGLDVAAIERFGGLLAAHRGSGGMVVAATHVPLPLPGAALLRLA